MKKWFIILLLVCVLTAGTIPVAVGEDGLLTVWAIESAQLTDYQTNGQSAWMEAQTGIPITWISTPRNGWYQAFQASVMSGEKVDVYLYDFDTSEATMLGSEMHYIIPLEDYITPEIAPNISAILEENPELKKLITAPDGHIYTLFTDNAYNLSAFKQKMWVNRYFLEKYTEDTENGMPKTTVEFENMLRYFATHDMNGDGKLNELPFIGYNGVDGMNNLFGAFLPANSSGNGYGCYYDHEGQLVFAYVQEAYKEALAYVRNLYQQGFISPDMAERQEDAVVKQALKGLAEEIHFSDASAFPGLADVEERIAQNIAILQGELTDENADVLARIEAIRRLLKERDMMAAILKR